MSVVHSQSPSGAMTVISANVEGLSDNKASILSELYKIQHCHCLCLQETHRAKDQPRPKIPGMTLVAERPHNKHGSSVFVRDGLKVNSISVCEEETVEFITVELPGVVVHSLYKPPPEPFLICPLGQRILLLYPLFNHPRRYSRFSGSRKLSSRIVLTGLSHKLSGVKVVGWAVQLNR